jgi:hypothetical protein
MSYNATGQFAPPGYGTSSFGDPALSRNSTGGSNNIANGFNGGKGLWDIIGGQNNFRAPEVVYDPTKSLAARDATQNAAAQMQPSANYYQALMSGYQPSLARAQANQAIGAGSAQQMHAAANSNGANRALAFQQAQNGASQAGLGAAIAGGQARLQETNRGAQGNLQASQGMAATNQAMRQQDINEQLGLIGQQTQRMGINAGITNANANNAQQGAGGIMSMAGHAMGAGSMASDERLKEDIRIDRPSYFLRGMR